MEAIVIAKPVPRSAQLTPRQKEILRLVVAGLDNKKIAEILGIAKGTVSGHVCHMFMKFRCNDRKSLADYAVKAGLVSQESSEDVEGQRGGTDHRA